MSVVNHIGTVNAPQDFLIGSGGSLVILQAAIQPAAPSRGVAEIRGEADRPALGVLGNVGNTDRAAGGSVEAGTVREAAGLGSQDSGTVYGAAGHGSGVITGEAGPFSARGFVVVSSSDSKIYVSLGIIEIMDPDTFAGYGALELRSTTTDKSPGSSDQTAETVRTSPGSVALATLFTSPGRGSIDTGAVSTFKTLGAAEIEAGEGLEIIIDIMDAILATAKGDGC